MIVIIYSKKLSKLLNCLGQLWKIIDNHKQEQNTLIEHTGANKICNQIHSGKIKHSYQ